MQHIRGFRFRLARELKKTLAEIDIMSLREFNEWYRVYRDKPFTAEMLENMLAIQSSLIANIELGKSKGAKLTDELDFLISIDEDEKKLIREQREIKANEDMKIDLMSKMLNLGKRVKK